MVVACLGCYFLMGYRVPFRPATHTSLISVVDIFTMILGVAVLLVFIGGPDESLNTEGMLYTFKAIVVPRAGLCRPLECEVDSGAR